MCFEPQRKLRARIITDRSKSVLLLWLLLFCVYVVGDLFNFRVLLQQTWV